MTEIRQLREIAKAYPGLLIVGSTTGTSWVCTEIGWIPSDYPSRSERLITMLEKELFSEQPQTLEKRWERIIKELDLK